MFKSVQQDTVSLRSFAESKNTLKHTHKRQRVLQNGPLCRLAE